MLTPGTILVVDADTINALNALASKVTRLESIVATLKPPEPRLLGAQDIADHLGVSRKHFLAKIATLPGFPRPKVNRSPRNRLWDAGEIEAWKIGR
jgi:predicted DNA-binding transcriptional regulator AlpA